MAIKEKDLIDKINKDLKYSSERMSGLHKAIRNDQEFAQGNQWDPKDVSTLKARGVKALVINKIKPIIKLLTGIERQSRSDMKALPEGGEDVISADIVTRLIKNVAKNSRVEVKQSEVFKNGSTGGMCFLEPFMDYSFDLINGDLKWRKVSPQQVYLDPDFQEYDLSDSRFLIKVTKDLSKEDLVNLFPEKENEIDKISNGRIDLDGFEGNNVQGEDYPNLTRSDKSVEQEREEDLYDLIDYYYKEMQTKFFVILEEQGQIKQLDTLEQAEDLVAQMQTGEIIERNVPVIMLCQKVGDTKLFNGVSWSYPRWKTYPIIPYFAELITEDLEEFSLKIQGVVRGIKSLNEEFNKRRTQELTHLNSSANSGFDVEKGALDETQLAKLKKYGSSAGIVIERNRGFAPINRITPMPLSQGHAQMAAENAQDLKEASGVNPDLLANDSQSQSGRAILLKQRQGLVMIQEMLDNFSETRRLIGRFILSQFNDLFTVESAMRILGDAFISDNFTVPVNIVIERVEAKLTSEPPQELTEFEESIALQYPNAQPNEPIVQEDGSSLVTVVDLDTAIQTVNNVLKDVNLNKYDIAIGEGPYEDTIRMANFMDLKELASQGVPIPPQLLLESSMLPGSEKNKALKMLAQASAQAPVEAAS